MKYVKIIHKKNAMTLIPKLINRNTQCYYLTADYAHFIDLRDRLADKINIQNLSGVLQETFQVIKEPLLGLISKLNKENDSLEWWGGQLASRNSESTPLFLNITYLFCAKKILAGSNKDILFIVDSEALSQCISNEAEEAGYKTDIYKNRMNEFLQTIKHRLKKFVQAFCYFSQIIRSRRAAFRLLKPLPANKRNAKKRIVLRSWVTKGNFNDAGEFKDRNFGSLPAWLCSKNYEVWHLPMFFDLSMPIKEVYTLMKNLEQQFLIPEHYIKFTDYVGVVYSSYRMLKKRLRNVTINNTNITPIFNEVLKRQGLDPTLLKLNLCVPMLKRLKEEEFEIDSFYYSFEGNVPEKPFVLCCREYFPNSKIMGFQHTTFFPNQLAYHLAPGEKDCHPLPDKIVCTGQIYVELHQKAGFPSEMLQKGANLRFESVYQKTNGNGRRLSRDKRNILLPLTFSHNMAFELFVKVRDALRNTSDYKVYIRTHPLLSKKSLVKFLAKIGLEDYEFADDGILQEWLPEIYATISAGGSITILESVSMGIPVVRVVPDNTFFYDPFFWPDYPLQPVHTSLEIRDQLQSIEHHLENDNEIFRRIGRQVLSEYFPRPTEENLQVFL